MEETEVVEKNLNSLKRGTNLIRIHAVSPVSRVSQPAGALEPGCEEMERE